MNLDKNYLKEVVLNDKIFAKVLKDANTVNLIYLSFNASLTKEMINILFKKNIENVNGNLLKNSLCDEVKIREFLSLKDKIYNIFIAHNENLSKEIYHELKNLKDKDVDISLSFNTKYLSMFNILKLF